MISILAAFVLTLAQAETRPFDPAYAADQPNVAFDSMFREMMQFQNFSSWASLKHELTVKQKECRAFDEKFARLRKMSKKLVSQAELDASEFRARICAAESELLEKRVENRKSAAASDKVMVIQMGNPGSDYRKELAQQLKGQIEFEGEQLKISRKIARLNKAHLKSRLDRNLPLCAKGVVPKVACEDQTREFEAALEREQAIDAEMDNNRLSLEGMKRSIERLFAGDGGNVAPGP